MKNIKEKILLITDVPPCKNLSGGAMTLQLIKFLLDEKYSLDIFLVNAREVNYKIDEEIIGNINVYQNYKPSENWKTDSNKKFDEEMEKITDSLEDTLENGNYTKIWGIIQGQVILELLDFIRKNTSISYVCQIWDTINWWMKANGYSKERRKHVEKLYYEIIAGSECCITASWGMNKFLQKKLPNQKFIELMPYVIKENIKYERQQEEKKFNIAMIGQVYATKELDALLTTLDELKWTIDGKEIYFHHYGNYSDSYINQEKHKEYIDRINIHGFVNQNALIHILKETSDLLYCPYFISNDDDYKEISETSFPSKFITYLATEIPILLQAPTYASPYIFAEEKNCAYLLDSNDVNSIKDLLKKIINVPNKDMVKKAQEAYENNFTPKIIKDKFFKALNIKKNSGLNILEVNYIDLPGKRFNGYDLLHYINDNTEHICNQIVTYKHSKDYHVKKFYENPKDIENEYTLLNSELKELSVHNVLSLTSNILKASDYFKNADLVHYHLVDNTKLSLCELAEICSLKPTIITLHDPWWFTGRCVYPQECPKWKTGCKNCEFLDTVFELPKDNCSKLWDLKKMVYKDLDVDIIVTTPYMVNNINESPLTNKYFKNIHLIPFGIDLEQFKNNISEKEAKKHYGIDNDNIVIFLRAQLAYKGTEYVLEAMKMLKTKKKITILTCSEKGILDELKDKYEVIDLGNIDDVEMKKAYAACDMFLMPSKGETFGLMAIEAMASSKPVVIFDNTALPFVTFAPECGVLVENKNSKKLMEAIKMLIENEDERIKRGKLGRKLCEENYDINTYHDRIMKAYEEAYNRQKNKKTIKYDFEEIDYNDENVQELCFKLRKIYRKMNFENPIDSNIFKPFKDKNIQIDYTNKSVFNLINKFNNLVYEEYKRKVIISESNGSANEQAHDFKRINKLKSKYYEKLKKHPILFICVRSLYRFNRDIVKYIRYKKID